MGKPENELRRAVMQFLNLQGVVVLRMNRGGGRYRDKYGSRWVNFGTQGMSDLLAILPKTGRAWWIELKTGGQTLTREQAAFMENMRLQGAATNMIRNLDELAAAWKELKNAPENP